MSSTETTQKMEKIRRSVTQVRTAAGTCMVKRKKFRGSWEVGRATAVAPPVAMWPVKNSLGMLRTQTKTNRNAVRK